MKDNLEKYLEDFQKKVDGNVGFGVWDKSSNYKFLYNENKKFTAASLNKIFVIGCILEKVNRKDIKLTDIVSIKDREVVSGKGIIHLLSVRKYSIDDLCLLAIAESDNTAANKLIDICGGLEAINLHIKNNDLKDTKITHKFMLYKGEPTSTVTVNDLMKYLNLISEKKMPFSEEFRYYLLEQKYRHRTAFAIKGKYGLKTADLPEPNSVVHDAGIVFDDKGDKLIVFLTEKVSDRRRTMIEMRKLIEKIIK